MILFRDREFAKINKFDCHIIDFADKHGSNYCEVLPSKVRIRMDDRFTHFDITNILGKMETVSIGHEHSAEIKAAMESAKRCGFLG